MHHLIICGSRAWPANKQHIIEYQLKRAHALGQHPIVITGGARGADRFGHEIARKLGFETTVIEADWDRYGKRAGVIRNQEMLELLIESDDEVWAFRVADYSPGTEHMMRIAKEAGVRVSEFLPSWTPSIFTPSMPAPTPAPALDPARRKLFVLRTNEMSGKVTDFDGVLTDPGGNLLVRQAALRTTPPADTDVVEVDRVRFEFLIRNALEV